MKPDVNGWIIGAVGAVAFVAVTLLVALADVYPHRPRTGGGWLLFIVVVPLAWLASEAIGDLLDREPLGRWVDRRTAHKTFSVVRILYLLGRTLALTGLAIWLVTSLW